jgi:hypothetical protein
MEIQYEQEELDILEACLDIALMQLEEKKKFFGHIALDLERDIIRARELKNRIRALLSLEVGNFIVFTRYEIYLLIEIVCDVLNYYKEEEYPRDTISKIMVAKKPLFDSIIARQSPSLFLSIKEKKKAS